MPDPQIEKLLILQDRDSALQRIESELLRIPRERSLMESEIAAERARIETAHQQIKELEVERHELDTEVKAREAATARFRTQQLEVKKNDEYRALTHQIEQNEADILKLEEQEIELMLRIDKSREQYEAEKAKIETRIEAKHKELARLAENETNLQEQSEDARTRVEEARAAVDSEVVGQYDRIKKMVKRPPYLAPLANHKCGGCHLRVSNEVVSSVRSPETLSFCDQCARIVFA